MRLLPLLTATRLPLGLTAALAAGLLAACGESAEDSAKELGGESEPTTSSSASSPTSSSPTTPPPTSKGPGDGAAYDGTPRVDGVIADELEVPWGLTFLPDGSAVVTERDSTRVLRLTPSTNGPATVRELGTVDVAAPAVEGGLLGVAASPDFAADHTLYLYATTDEDNQVLRVDLDGDALGEPEVVLDGIPKGAIHDGGRLAFGPDDMLYVSTGETGDQQLAQDPASLAGKILRVTPGGEPAPGNPDADSPVWSLGHRNVQGLAFDEAGRLWASEFGESTWDELNLIEKGGNYGWPEVEGPSDESAGNGAGSDFIDPVATWSTDQASPSGLAFAEGTLWMASLRGETLWQIPLDGERAGEPVARFRGQFGRLRAVAQDPGGDLWVATSNRDGRGDPVDEDDRILRVRLGR